MKWRVVVGIVSVVAAATYVMAAPPQEEKQTMNTIELNLATNLRGLLKFTNDKDESRKVDVDISVNGADPVVDATLRVKPTDGKKEWLTCHVLFPEVILGSVPQSVEFMGEVMEGNPKITIDAADPNGPCIAIPMMQDGKWLGEKGNIQLKGQKFMVWKEKRTRELGTPLRLKYLLIFSPSGDGFTVKLSGLRIHL
jgi:hypothetical protein